MENLKVLVSRRFSTDVCRKNSDTLFIFGDSLERYGEAGQAIIRNQENAIGFATKHKPGTNKEDYFTDDEYEENCQIIEKEIERIKRYAEEKEYKNIIFPFMGLGTGLAQMPLRAIRTFSYLCLRLSQAWEYNNLEGQFTLKN